MRSRRGAAILLTLALFSAACQLLWSYDELKDQPGTGRGVGGAASSSGGRCEGSTRGDAGCALGGPDGGACTDCCDQAILAARGASIDGDVHACVYPPNQPFQPDMSVLQGCLVAKDLLSRACAGCWTIPAQCELILCPKQCTGGASLACSRCLAQSCNEDFRRCSGVDLPEVMDGGADAPED